MCPQNTGKFAKGYTFLITITENSGLCTKYVGKPFASLGTKYHDARERFTNLYFYISNVILTLCFHLNNLHIPKSITLSIFCQLYKKSINQSINQPINQLTF